MKIRARHTGLQTNWTAPAPNKLPSDLAIARCWKSSDAIQSGHLLSYLIKHRLITEHQFGFVPGISTTHQMQCIVDDWLQALDDGKESLLSSWTFRKRSAGCGMMDYYTN